MRIQGLQKLTLLDYPGKTACTVFLGGCDFRCHFCHNGELALGSAPDYMSEPELFSFLQRRVGLIDGVCISGGEPLLRPGICEMIARIRELGFSIKLDSNGNHPARLKELVGRGLIDYVAMDIKNSPERYPQTVGLSWIDITPVRESVSFLLSGTVEYEFRTTVVREFHDKEAFLAIGEWIRGAKRYYLQAFEDAGRAMSAGLTPCSAEEMSAFARTLKPFVSEVKLRGL